MTLGINFNSIIAPQYNNCDTTKLYNQSAFTNMNAGIFPSFVPQCNVTTPNELNVPYSLESMMNFWNNNQAQMQALMISILASMASAMPRIPKIVKSNVTIPANVNKTNVEKISELRPEMQEKTLQLMDYAKNVLGKEITINSGFRTAAEQEYLRQKTPHLAAAKSAHCEGKAVDLSISGGTDEDYYKLGQYAKSIGMRWGGDFKSQKERWHFDYDWR